MLEGFGSIRSQRHLCAVIGCIVAFAALAIVYFVRQGDDSHSIVTAPSRLTTVSAEFGTTITAEISTEPGGTMNPTQDMNTRPGATETEVFGRIVSSQGTPIADAIVRASSGISTRADDDGRMALSLVLPVKIDVRAGGFDSTSFDIEATPLRSLDLGTITLKSAGTITVRLVTASGAAVAGVAVAAWAGAPGGFPGKLSPRARENEWAALGDTDDDGVILVDVALSRRETIYLSIRREGRPGRIPLSFAVDQRSPAARENVSVRSLHPGPRLCAALDGCVRWVQIKL